MTSELQQPPTAREILHLQRPLAVPLPPPCLPEGISIANWRDADAPRTHALLEHCYRGGGGSVDPYAEWLEWFTNDAEFDAASCFLAWHEREVVGVALCWSSAFVKDLCVVTRFRRRGLGFGLLTHVLWHFQSRGAEAVELRSHSDNPSGANHLYEKLGFLRTQS
jgi:ribosomal protein S18 acetylase RimI-like enzyme